MRKNFLALKVCTLFICFSLGINAQKTASYSSVQHDFQEGVTLFDQGLYAASQPFFEKVMNPQHSGLEPSFEMMQSKAQLYFAKAAVRLGKPEAERLVLDFVQSEQPNPVAIEAQMEIASYYYNDQDFDQAIQYYEMLDPKTLTKDQKAEAQFKKGYSLFVNKEFESAAQEFGQSLNLRTIYYYPTNYYYGLTQFFMNDYESALKSFDRVNNSEKYARYIPYYITQIQFELKNYDEVVSYGTKHLDQSHLQNKKEIHKLIGQSYFEQEKYEEALPHLSYYESKSGKMRAEDFFQLGFVQYQLGQCDEAVQNFQELRNLATPLGLQSYIFMADCYVKNGDLTSARTAFKTVVEQSKDSEIRNQAIFNYGKLSAQLNYDQEAIKSFQAIPLQSIHYTEGQNILKQIFIQTRDYKHAIKTLESMPNLSTELQEAYQKVTLSQGIQLINDTQLGEAQELLDLSIKYTPNKSLQAQSLFWIGELNHFKNDFHASIASYNKYFSVAGNLTQLPIEVSPAMAHYNQGYNYLKTGNYSLASQQFEQAISDMESIPRNNDNGYIHHRLLADALLRNGDALFKQNRYADALVQYNKSIDQKKPGYVYAIYQKAIIKGLQNSVFDKIALLQDITRNHSSDLIADDAYLQLGITFQENGQAGQAVSTFNELVTNHDKDPQIVNEAFLRLGLISYNNGDAQSALKYYKQIFNRNADPITSKEALTAIEEIYIHDLGQPEEFVRYMESLPGYDVSDFKKDSLTFVAANTKYENAAYEVAIDNFNDYLSKFPNGIYKLQVLYHRGESNGMLKNYSLALKDYQMLIQEGQSEFYEKTLRKAAIICYNHTLNFEQAFNYYEAMEQVASDDESKFEAQLGALRSAYRVHNQVAVIEKAGSVIANPSASIEHISTSYFYRGKIFFDQNEFQLALKDFNQVSKLINNAHAAEARYLIAKIYFTQKEFDIAEQICLNVNKESSNYPQWVVKSVILLSDIYVATEDLFNARAALEAVIENYNGDDASIKNEARQKLQALNEIENNKSRIVKDNLDGSTKLQMIENNEGNN